MVIAKSLSPLEPSLPQEKAKKGRSRVRCLPPARPWFPVASERRLGAGRYRGTWISVQLGCIVLVLSRFLFLGGGDEARAAPPHRNKSLRSSPRASGVSSGVVGGLVRAGWLESGVPTWRSSVGVKGWVSVVSAFCGGDGNPLLKDGEGGCLRIGCVGDGSGCFGRDGAASCPDLDLKKLGGRFLQLMRLMDSYHAR